MIANRFGSVPERGIDLQPEFPTVEHFSNRLGAARWPPHGGL
jgi:hypothetical protein